MSEWVAAPVVVERLRRRPVDVALVATFLLFACTSLVMELYLLNQPILEVATDPLGRAWYLYASRWDPLFLDPPLLLRIMSGLSALVFGPGYLLLAWGFWHARPWVRTLGLIQGTALAYSTTVYLLAELLGEGARSDLPMVLVINGPYLVVPLGLIARVWRTPVFKAVRS